MVRLCSGLARLAGVSSALGKEPRHIGGPNLLQVVVGIFDGIGWSEP